MCDFCKDTDGNLCEPIICKTVRLGPLDLMFDAWVWNENRVGKLWFAIEIGDRTVLDTQIPIRHCPICGRNLEV